MARYLIQVDPVRTEQVKSNLGAIKIGVISQVFDYLTVDVPPEVVSRIRAISGVIDVRPETKVKSLGLLDTLNALKLNFPFLAQPAEPVEPIPIERKIPEFVRLFLSHPVTGPAEAFRYAASDVVDKWPTGESRKVVGADIAEAEGITGKGVKVAVIDTGVVFTTQGHYLDLESKSSVEGQPIPWDENGHGTWCASCISGSPFRTPFGLLKGIAPDCKVLVVKCLGYGLGAGTESSVMRALMDAYQWGADIISASLGSGHSEEPPENIPECRAIRMLTNAGVINVWANGNDGPKPYTVGVPANEPSALSVGAIDHNGEIAGFSSRGPTATGLVKPDCVAPGVNVTSSSTGLIAFMRMFRDFPGTATISGTSMATPHCVGVVALALQYARSKGKRLTTDNIKEALELYGQPKNNDYGWGLITYSKLKRYIDQEPSYVITVPEELPEET